MCIRDSFGGVGRKKSIRVSEPSPEMQEKIRRARCAIVNQKIEVYKRQIRGLAKTASRLRSEQALVKGEQSLVDLADIVAVSYTHLDVYKRQLSMSMTHNFL